MSTTSETKRQSEDQGLGRALLRKKLLTDGQLRAATDYQRSLGGSLSEVVVKLGLLRPAQLEDFLQGTDGEATQRDLRSTDGVVDPQTVNAADLKLHRKLLEKIPQDLQEKFLLVPFFPLPGGDPRKIVMGHGYEITAEAVAKISAILGVELCTLALEEPVARELCGQDARTEGRRAPSAHSRAEEQPAARPEVLGASPASSPEQTQNALLALLIRKGLISREELDTELALLSGRRKKASEFGCEG